MDTAVSWVGVEGVGYAQGSGTVRTQFDQEKTPASMAVVAPLADVMDADREERDPLHSTVDLHALDALVRVPDGTIGDTHVAFTHESHTITVHSSGVVAITPEHEPAAENDERGGGR